MEPALLAAMIGCMVAVGAGVFVAIQGSKQAKQNKSDDDATDTTNSD
jgi:hypothetical protein